MFNSFKKLCQLFKNKGNNDDLFIKAKKLSPLVTKSAVEATKTLFKELKKKWNMKIDDKSGKVVLETLLFYLHYIDRIAYHRFGARQRDIFMDALLAEIEQWLLSFCENKTEATGLSLAFEETYSKRQREYAPYKLLAEKNGEISGTIFWEFGKKIAGILGDENNIAVILLVKLIIHSSLMALPLPDFFKK